MEKEKEGNKWRKVFFVLGVEEKRRWKRTKYLEIENIFFWRRRKMGKEKEENIWRRKIFFFLPLTLTCLYF